MDSEGPWSVLDHRNKSSRVEHVIADGVTRQRSSCSRGGEGVPFHPGGIKEVIYRISQPYRTSFSATCSVTWTRAGCRQPLELTSNHKSDLSTPRRRPARECRQVTYKRSISVRHSDTDDSFLTEMSSEHENIDSSLQSVSSPYSRSLISPKYNQFSHLSLLPPDQRTLVDNVRLRGTTWNNISSTADKSWMSQDSGVDLSVQHATPNTSMQCSPEGNMIAQIAESSPSKVLTSGDNTMGVLPQLISGDVATISQEAEQNSSTIAKNCQLKQQCICSRVLRKDCGLDVHEMKMVKEDELEFKQLIEDNQHQNNQPQIQPGSACAETSGQSSSKDDETQQKTVRTHSVGGRITKFLKRISPPFRYRKGVDNSKSRPTGRPPRPDSEPCPGPSAIDIKDVAGQLKNKRSLRSVFSLIGTKRSRSGSHKKTVAGIVDSPEESNFKSQDQNSLISQSSEDVRNTRTNSELNTSSSQPDSEVHHFHDVISHRSTVELTENLIKGIPEVSLATPISHCQSPSQLSHSEESVSDNACMKSELRTSCRETPNASVDGSGHRPVLYNGSPAVLASCSSPAGSLLVPEQNLLQTSFISGMLFDDRIGVSFLHDHCPGNEHLLNGTSQSIDADSRFNDHSLVGNENSDRRDTSQIKEQIHSENKGLYSSGLGPPSPTEQCHKPSYLKLSCTVSGYSKYSHYSAYKDVSMRSLSSGHIAPSKSTLSPASCVPEQMARSVSSSEHLTRLKSSGWDSSLTDSPQIAVNGHFSQCESGDVKKNGEYFLQHVQFEKERISDLCLQAEADLRSHDLPEEVCGRIRAAIGKANLLLSQKFIQFVDLCHGHMQPNPDERETKLEDLQGFWDMVKIQIDSVDDMFAEIDLMRHNSWHEVPQLHSRRSSTSSSLQSGSVSQSSTPMATPSHTPGSRRKMLTQSKDTPESSPERTHKARQAAKARDEARKKMLLERRAAMKQATSGAASGDPKVEIYIPEQTEK